MTLIAQITDLHLRDDGAYSFHDPTGAVLRAFDRLAAADLRPNAIVLTGDIIDRSSTGYADAVVLLRKAPVPLLPLPGNHDRAAEFRAAFAGWADFHPDHLSFTQPVGEVTVIGLDSTLPLGKGGVDAARLDWLASALAKEEGPVILAMHHPPFPTGASHIDAQGFARASDLARVVSGSRVRRLIAGHTHRGIQTQWAGVLASTCTAAGFGLDLSLRDGKPHTPTGIAPGFELHLVRPGLTVCHQVVLPWSRE